MTKEDQILKYLKRINEKLTILLSDTKKEKGTWVKASVITGLTGWDKGDMTQARKNGYVKFKKDADNKLWYNLESISPMLINEKK